MPIRLGVDTLCWHLRLESGRVSVADVLGEAAVLGAECVQVNLHHVRAYDADGLHALAERSRELGLVLLASGDFLGEGRNGDTTDIGVGRVESWLARAVALGSPLLRIVSGFYRADLMGWPDLVDVERRYVTDVLLGAVPLAAGEGVTLLLENHSDFTVEEYRAIFEEVGGDGVGVFLDLINPISALDDPLPVIEQLAPLAGAGHVKDYVLRSIPTDDGYHRRGFEVLYRYPGEGVADLAALTAALRRGLGGRELFLTVEGLDNRADVDDQRERLSASLSLLRELVA